MSSCDSLTTQASSFLASERPKMTGVERSGRSSNHFTKRVCFFVPKRGNQCTKEERLSHARCFFSSERPKMKGGERSGRLSNHFTKRVCFFMRKRGNQCMKEDRLSHSRCFFSSERPKMTGGERSRRSSEVKGTQTVLVSFERKCGRLSEVF